MNKTQKGAWFGLTSILFVILLYICLGVYVFVIKTLPNKNFIFGVLFCYVLLGLTGLVLSQRKRNFKEVDSDERDKYIQKRAVLVSFVSVFILLFAQTIVPRFIVGLEGSIPVWILAFINVAIFFLSLLIYFVALLVQYDWRSKDGKN